MARWLLKFEGRLYKKNDDGTVARDPLGNPVPDDAGDFDIYDIFAYDYHWPPQVVAELDPDWIRGHMVHREAQIKNQERLQEKAERESQRQGRRRGRR